MNKIFIVDDDPINVEILREILIDKYHIEVSTSAQEAIGKISEFKPEVVLLDVMMKGIDGYQLCRRIREMPGLRFLKIIMVSAKAMDADRLEGYESGADDYLAKPFNQDELLAKVGVYLKLKSEEEINELKSDLLLLLSHETNTPLNSIKGFSELLLKMPFLTEEQRKYVDIIVKAGNDLEQFIKKAIILGGLRGKSARMEFNSYSFGPLIKEVIDELSPQVDAKHIKVSVNNRISVHISCQKNLMKSALKFVLENAIRFSPDGECVDIWAEQDDDIYQIHVTDHGEGIKANNVESVFDIFGIQDVQHHHRGHGLSLAIARNIIERHGGSLKARNNENGGASFIFKLPVREIPYAFVN